MQNLAKYFLVLAVMGGGFYAAQQHRRPSGVPLREDIAERQTAEASSEGAKRMQAEPASSDQLPVAALADVDRVPLVGSDRSNAFADAKQSEVASVTHQPTLRAERPTEQASSANSAKRANSNSSELTSSEPVDVKPQAKKPVAKKAATDRPQDNVTQKVKEKDGGKGRGGSTNTDRVEGQGKDFVPPELAPEYRPQVERAEISQESQPHKEASSRPTDAPARQDAASLKPDVAQSKAKPKAKKIAPEAAPRRHRIAEGDTLKTLAEKYLGSRDRYLDLFQANIDVLFDPRLIPIGVEIVIPERTTIVAQAALPPATGDSATPDTDLSSED